MKSAIIQSSAIAKYGRLDAAFHIAIQGVADKAAALESEHTAVELLQRLGQLDAADLKPLAPLLRLSRERGRKEDYLRAAQEYPFIAYALARAGIEDALKRTEAEIAERQSYLANLKSI